MRIERNKWCYLAVRYELVTVQRDIDVTLTFITSSFLSYS